MKKYTIVHEDTDLLIIDKPQGLPTAPGKQKENLFDLVSSDFPATGTIKGYKESEGGLLNRLDNETGGLVFFALTQRSFDFYSMMMKNEMADKTYHAIVEGIPDKQSGIIGCMIAHDRKNKRKMTCLGNESILHRSRGQKALTEWKILDSHDGIALLEVHIAKGVRHQIRVHLAHMGHPIIGDRLYNREKYGHIENHLLYCIGVKFTSMANNDIDILIESPLINMFKNYNKIFFN